MSVIFDTETQLFRPGVMAPEIVCLSYQWTTGANRPVLVHWKDAEALIETWLNPRLVTDVLVGHNVAYDMTVIAAQWPHLLPAIFDAYDADRVTDTMIRQKLLDIACGQYRGAIENGRWRTYSYDLDSCYYRATGCRLNKAKKKKQLDDGEVDTSWQLRYGQLRDVPLEAWDVEARDYALTDAAATTAVFLAQEPYAPEYLKSQWRLVRRDFWLHLMSNWGLRTDADAVEAVRVRTETARDEVAGRLRDACLVRKDGSRDTKAAAAYMLEVCRREGIEPRRNEPTEAMIVKGLDEGSIKLDADSCAATSDPLLADYAQFTTLGYILSKDVKSLAKGTIYPIHTHFDIAETERTTSSKPNVQNWSRDVGPREAFRPRRGYIYWDADYGQIELHTLAQMCVTMFGQSKLAEELNAGIDPHASMAAHFMGKPYQWIIANKHDPQVMNARQTGKVFNFGTPGGLGADKLVLFARKQYGVTITREQAVEYKQMWLERLPEMRLYFAWANERVQEGEGLATIVCPFTGSVRGGTRYCNTCNTPFQRLAASCATEAGWLIARACYVERDSVLFGDRPVNFVHDQWMGETLDNANAHDHLLEVVRLMQLGANKYLPDVPCKVEGQLERIWSKKAHAILDANGRNVPWWPGCPCKDCQKKD